MKQLLQQIPRKRQNLACRRLLICRKKHFCLNLQQHHKKRSLEHRQLQRNHLLFKKNSFYFYPTDLVNAKTTIPLTVGSQRYIQSNLAFSNSVNSKPRYFEGRSNALGFTLPLDASPVISKPRYFELFFHFPWDFEIAGFDCICTSTLRVSVYSPTIHLHFGG